jgi:hypothetical protein
LLSSAAQVQRRRVGKRLRVEAEPLLVRLAVDRRRALARAARIEGDDVEALVERVEEPLAAVACRKSTAGATGPPS